MTRRRWIADEFSDTHAALTGAHADHLIRVLRARVGQEFDIATGPVVRRGRIVTVADNRVEFELAKEISASPALALTLLLAIFKFDRMEWAIEKCTELGVSRIVPVIARRTDAHLATASVKRAERWRRIALQAAEQSRRATPPEIAAPIELQEAVAQPGRPARCAGRIRTANSSHRLAFFSRARRNWTGHRSRRGLDRRRVESISEFRMVFRFPGFNDFARRNCRHRCHGDHSFSALKLSDASLRSGEAASFSGAEFSQPSSDILPLMPPSKSIRRSSPFIPDERQREAIEHVQGPMLVLAGAGTGKTSVLTHRIERLVREGHAYPHEILALTYTRNAANEMRDRVGKLLGGKEVNAATFHDYCLDLLKRVHKDFGVLDDKDLWIYLRRRIRDLRLEHYIRAANVAQFLNDLLDFVSRCHDELVTPENYADYVERLERKEVPIPRVAKSKNVLDDDEVLGRCREIARVFTTMERWLAEENLGTFSHMITRAHSLLHHDDNVLAEARARARFILADEFQDANFAQIQILARLVGAEGNIFAVGDPDQAIYRFRGASSAAFELFDSHFPNAKRVVLEKNRRSTTPILRSAFALIDKNPPVFSALGRHPLTGACRCSRPAKRKPQRQARNFPARRCRSSFSPAETPRAPTWSPPFATRRKNPNANGPTSASSTALTSIAMTSSTNWPRPIFPSSSRAWTSPTLPKRVTCLPA